MCVCLRVGVAVFSEMGGVTKEREERPINYFFFSAFTHTDLLIVATDNRKERRKESGNVVKETRR